MFRLFQTLCSAFHNSILNYITPCAEHPVKRCVSCCCCCCCSRIVQQYEFMSQGIQFYIRAFILDHYEISCIIIVVDKEKYHGIMSHNYANVRRISWLASHLFTFLRKAW